MRAKKEAKKKWAASGRQEDGDSYRRANKAAKKEVARSKAHAMDAAYKELETTEGEERRHKTSHKSDRSRMYTGLCYGNRRISRIGGKVTLRCY